MAVPKKSSHSATASPAGVSPPGQTTEPTAPTATATSPQHGTATPLSDTGRYTLGAEIARGGMGVVYRATDTTLDREVAIKVLQDKFVTQSSAIRRFVDEARITGQLQHPGIPPVHDLGVLPDGRPFLAMKLYKGQTLDERLRHDTDAVADRGPLVAAFEQVCQAVAYAHAHQVIHRDLKPANVMAGAFGEVQVMDWGLAKVLGSRQAAATDAELTTGTEVRSLRDSDGLFTQAGSVLGTPAFMPPEQAIGAVDQIDARSDVFGLGGILCAILTGLPPFVAGSAESVRQLAAQGKLAEAFARLDACQADPDLVSLCKRCLSRDKEDRPLDGGAVAEAVAALRAASDERARRAELDRVKAEGEKATAEARAAERRKRRRVWTGAVAALTAATVLGLAAVLLVQRRANADLEIKNRELADEQAKVQARFELAQSAITTFHTGVSEDVLLKQDQFKELRTKLLQQAAGFYAQLEKLLEGLTDARSRRAVGEGYFQLAQVTEKIGSKPEALAVHRNALAVRREQAAVPGADVATRLDVARSLLAIGSLLEATGKSTEALAAYEEGRDLAEPLAAEDPSDAVRAVQANSFNAIGDLFATTGKHEAALASYRIALALRQRLADANPGVTQYHSDLAQIHNNIGKLLYRMKTPGDALEWFEKAKVIQQQLADANPGVTRLQSDLAKSHNNIGAVLSEIGKPAEALEASRRALAIKQKLADANPTVTQFQKDLASSHNNIGLLLARKGQPRQALESFRQALAVNQKLADANPAVTQFQSDLAWSHGNISNLQSLTGKPEEALDSCRQALAIKQKLVVANPTVTLFQRELALSHHNHGELLVLAGQPGKAVEAHREALGILQKLADANPTVPEFQSGLALCYRDLGRLHGRQKRFADAFAALDQSVALCQKLIQDDPDNADCVSELGESHAYRGWARIGAGEPAEAATELRQAVGLLAKNPAPSLALRFERSRTLALLAGLGGNPKSGVTTEEAVTFADQAVAALRDAANAGWAQLSRLDEPDFDALRGRDDFKQLRADVAAKTGVKDQEKD